MTERSAFRTHRVALTDVLGVERAHFATLGRRTLLIWLANDRGLRPEALVGAAADKAAVTI